MLQHGRGVSTAASFVFIARTTGTGRVARRRVRFGSLGLGSFCWGGFDTFEEELEVFCSIAHNGGPSGDLYAFDAGESADGISVEIFGQAFCPDLAFGLEAAEFVDGAEKLTLGFGSGAIDADLGPGEERVFGFVIALSCGRRFHLRFSDSATAEPPRGVDDFGCEGLFERALRAQVLFEVVAEEFVGVDFVRRDEVGRRVDAEGDGIARGSGFAFLGARAGRGFGVAAVGSHLRFRGHG